MSRRTLLAWRIACVTLFCALFTQLPLHAQVILNPTVTSIGGVYTFDYAITNNTPLDLALVSIDVPALPGAVFDLMTPTGFFANFDSGLGIVDFAADTDSFAPGSTLSGFRFSSRFAPGAARFETLDVQGNTFAGRTVAAAVPEPGSLSLLGALGMGSLLLLRRSRKVRATPSSTVLQEENP